MTGGEDSAFKTTTTCPHCGDVGAHGIEPAPEPPEVIRWHEAVITDSYGIPIRTRRVPVYAPETTREATQLNTSTCNHVRTCRSCGRKWGER